MSFKENSNLCPSCYMMKSQLDNNNNIRTLNVIKEQDYANFRQLMDIALKNFSLKEKHKYMERVFDNSNHSISIGYPSSYCFEYCEDDIFSEWSSNEASGQLPYEINFDDDDDFEQVLPKFVTWDLATTESDMSSSNIKTTDDSDFQYINCVSKTKSTNSLNKPRERKKKEGLWTKVKKVFTRLIQCFSRKQKKSEHKTFERTTDNEFRNGLRENRIRDQGRSTREETYPLLHSKGNYDGILAGGRVNIDICELGYDILMRNVAREACRHPSCNQDANIWSSHLPCPQDEFYSLPCIQELSPQPEQHLYNKNHTTLYTPKMKSYFIQPSITPKQPNLTKQFIHPALALRTLIDWTIENELYL